MPQLKIRDEREESDEVGSRDYDNAKGEKDVDADNEEYGPEMEDESDGKKADHDPNETW